MLSCHKFCSHQSDGSGIRSTVIINRLNRLDCWKVSSHTLPEIRKSVQDFTEVEVETQIGARTWRVLCSFRPHACADMALELSTSARRMMPSRALGKPLFQQQQKN
jgi:hypothetical protein